MNTIAAIQKLIAMTGAVPLLFGALACSDLRAGPENDEAVEVASASLTWTARKFGVYAAYDYQNGWQSTLDEQWGVTNNFVSNLDDTDTKMFYGGMYLGNQTKWYDALHDGAGADNQTGGVDTVDLFFNVTHGGYTNDAAQWAMYPTNYFIWNNRMRLGNDGGINSIFATMACNSMVMDSYTVKRWKNMFRGGMRIAHGSPQPLYAGWPNEAVGTAFADNLQAGDKLYLAWHNALRAYDSTSPSATMATGTNSTNCTSRLLNMTWQNFKSATYPRIRDNDIGYYCWVYWHQSDSSSHSGGSVP